MKATRREFFGGAAAATAVVAAAVEEKTFDGGLGSVSPVGAPERSVRVLPAGSGSIAAFGRKCVACQLCVSVCPQHVLRAAGRSLQPEMSFVEGWCRPDCSKCGEVCPAGAIEAVEPARKRLIHTGYALWHQDRCLAAVEGENCRACYEHCPVKAVYLMPADRENPVRRVPFVDRGRCIGCGACEHSCPARPLPAMTVEGCEVHRETAPRTAEDAVAEARQAIADGRASALFIRDGVIVEHAWSRGLGALVALFDGAGGDLQGVTVVDKVIGRAAAAFCVLGHAKRVEAVLMSEGAKAFLEKHGVAAAADRVVPAIRNRRDDGECPLELSVKRLDNPARMVRAARAKLSDLQKQKNKE